MLMVPPVRMAQFHSVPHYATPARQHAQQEPGTDLSKWNAVVNNCEISD